MAEESSQHETDETEDSSEGSNETENSSEDSNETEDSSEDSNETEASSSAEDASVQQKARSGNKSAASEQSSDFAALAQRLSKTEREVADMKKGAIARTKVKIETKSVPVVKKHEAPPEPAQQTRAQQRHRTLKWG